MNRLGCSVRLDQSGPDQNCKEAGDGTRKAALALRNSAQVHENGYALSRFAVNAGVNRSSTKVSMDVGVVFSAERGSSAFM